MGSPSSLVIREMTGGQHNLVLQGRALPYRGLKFEGTMRAEVTWYPGSPQGTAQMLGPDEGSTTIQGMWKDRFLKSVTDEGTPLPSLNPPGKALFDGSLLADVMSIVRTVDGFRRRGQLLEVGWDELVRYGFLRRFSHNWQRREDVEWEMEFQWIGQEEPTAPVAFGVDLALPSVVNQIVAAYDALVAACTATFQVVSAVANTIADALDAIAIATAALADMAQKAEAAVMLPVDAAKAMIATFQSVRDEVGVIIDSVTSLPAAALRSTPDITTIDLAQSIEAAEYQRGVKKAGYALRDESVRQADDLAARTTSQEIAATVVAREGEDLRDISQLFYDTPDQWRQLATFNGIKGSLLHAGDVVLVPKQPVGA